MPTGEGLVSTQSPLTREDLQAAFMEIDSQPLCVSSFLINEADLADIIAWGQTDPVVQERIKEKQTLAAENEAIRLAEYLLRPTRFDRIKVGDW